MEIEDRRVKQRVVCAAGNAEWLLATSAVYEHSRLQHLSPHGLPARLWKIQQGEPTTLALTKSVFERYIAPGTRPPKAGDLYRKSQDSSANPVITNLMIAKLKPRDCK